MSEYDQGVALEFEVVTRTGGDTSPGELLRSAMSEESTNTGVPDGVLRFGVDLGEGRIATTLDYPLVPSVPPEQPYLGTVGGPGFKIDGDEMRSQQLLWLWPAPGSVKLDVVVEWPVFDIPVTRTSLEVDN
ncbi:hypothetical protein [Amycolatopsis tucumanensis]|nr:hypothetical protein [Amycolatopsis tucumanensis]MCF6423779.1 hypothetical protein [Amycolatopsis tucumanensis]